MDLAARDVRIVVTEDRDFGRLYYRYKGGRVGVIVLNLRPQSVTAANLALERFFSDPATASIQLDRSLVLIDDLRVRVTTQH